MLAIIYLFENDSDLIFAENNGLIEKLRKETIDELIANGYPKEAFNKNIANCNIADKFYDMNNFQESLTYSLENPSVRIDFISNESVQNEADGNLFYYLK